MTEKEIQTYTKVKKNLFHVTNIIELLTNIFKIIVPNSQ